VNQKVNYRIVIYVVAFVATIIVALGFCGAIVTAHSQASTQNNFNNFFNIISDCFHGNNGHHYGWYKHPCGHGLGEIQKNWELNLPNEQGMATGTITEWLTDNNGHQYGGNVTLTYTSGQGWSGGQDGNPQYNWKVAQLSGGAYYIINYEYSFTILDVTITGSGTDTYDGHNDGNLLIGSSGGNPQTVINTFNVPPI
jgi:hypothetical protein